MMENWKSGDAMRASAKIELEFSFSVLCNVFTEKIVSFFGVFEKKKTKHFIL